MDARLTAWHTEPGGPLPWEHLLGVLAAHAPAATAFWADLDGLRLTAVRDLPEQMPSTTRMWLWSPEGDLWRAVPLLRPDAPAVGRLTRLDGLDGAWQRPTEVPGVRCTTLQVTARRLEVLRLTDAQTARLDTVGEAPTLLHQVEAALAVPLRFVALR